jgi:glycosyltransferase involved in cell wall biosynthesis
MKVLVIIPYYSSIYGGNTRVVKELYQSLGTLDIEIDLITTDADGDGKLNVPLETWIEKNNYRVRFFPCVHRYDFTLSLSLIRWLNHSVENYDIVHTHNRFSPLISICEFICQIKCVPFVATPHGMLEPWAMAYKAWKKLIYFSIFDRATLQNASRLHVLTLAEAENIRKQKIDVPSRVIANGIKIQDFSNSVSPELFYQSFPQLKGKVLILFLARIDPKKGLDLIAQAFAQVITQFPDVHLVLAGPDSPGYLDTARKFFIDKACIDKVTFTGLLSGKLKFSALTAATIYVAPYYSEGFSMSILEGMASGLPSVITTGCNFPEAAKANVAKVVDINAWEIADGILELLRNPQKAEEMGIQARKFIFENYTWDIASVRLKQLFLEITTSQSH